MYNKIQATIDSFTLGATPDTDNATYTLAPNDTLPIQDDYILLAVNIVFKHISLDVWCSPRIAKLINNDFRNEMLDIMKRESAVRFPLQSETCDIVFTLYDSVEGIAIDSVTITGAPLDDDNTSKLCCIVVGRLADKHQLNAHEFSYEMEIIPHVG